MNATLKNITAKEQYMSSKDAKSKLKQGFQEFEEKDVVEQSLALANIIKDLLETTKQHLNKIYVILAVSLLTNLIIVGTFLWYESHMNTTVETRTETVTTQTVDGENSEINNVKGNQYKDNAIHNDSGNDE